MSNSSYTSGPCPASAGVRGSRVSRLLRACPARRRTRRSRPGSPRRPPGRSPARRLRTAPPAARAAVAPGQWRDLGVAAVRAADQLHRRAAGQPPRVPSARRWCQTPEPADRIDGQRPGQRHPVLGRAHPEHPAVRRRYRIDPPPSVPTSSGVRPAATATAVLSKSPRPSARGSRVLRRRENAVVVLRCTARSPCSTTIAPAAFSPDTHRGRPWPNAVGERPVATEVEHVSPPWRGRPRSESPPRGAGPTPRRAPAPCPPPPPAPRLPGVNRDHRTQLRVQPRHPLQLPAPPRPPTPSRRGPPPRSAPRSPTDTRPPVPP